MGNARMLVKNLDYNYIIIVLKRDPLNNVCHCRWRRSKVHMHVQYEMPVDLCIERAESKRSRNRLKEKWAEKEGWDDDRWGRYGERHDLAATILHRALILKVSITACARTGLYVANNVTKLNRWLTTPRTSPARSERNPFPDITSSEKNSFGRNTGRFS